MSRATLSLDAGLIEYIRRLGIREPAPLKALRDHTASLPRANMQISPEQGQLMQLLTAALGVRNALELGTFTGYSAACVAMSLPADGKLVACDISTEYTDVGRPYWDELGVTDRIDLRIGEALGTLDGLIAAGCTDHFDWAFVDADKGNMVNYLDRCLVLVRVGGIIAFDNTLWSGRVADPECHDEDTVAIRAINERLHADDRLQIALIPIGDGLTLARRLR
jgi:predicted O-methyltransferase YrrM